MTIRKSANACLVSLLAGSILYSATASAQSSGAWEPCGGNTDKLWAWGWAGNSSQHLTIENEGSRKRITRMNDISGNGNHFLGAGEAHPGYQVGLSRNGYSTSLPLVAVDTYSDGTAIHRQYLNQSNSMAAQQFYLAFAGMDSRPDGHRVVWGSTNNDRFRLDQDNNRANITIGGNEYRLTGDDAWDNGPVLVEVWRDAGNSIRVWVNGTDVTSGTVTESATFDMSGIGGGAASGGSAWDDYAFEYVACKGLPTTEQRNDVREYLRSKWGLYGASSPPPVAPNAPGNFGAQ